MDARADIVHLSQRLGLGISASEVGDYERLMSTMVETIDRFQSLPTPEPRIARTTCRDVLGRPVPGEDPLNAIAQRCLVEGAASGVLSGVRTTVKDLVPIASVPMSAGTEALCEYVPNEDAELTRRLLDAGATIVATTNMDAMAFSAGGDSCRYGVVHNPFDPSRTACGSSSGAAASLFYEGIDLSWGTDTAGSIRIPASWCGVIGLKPTHGIVPATGVLSPDWNCDHIGPLARSTAMIARGLDAVVSGHSLDIGYPDTARTVPTGGYLESVMAAPTSLSGLRVAVIVEGFRDILDPGGDFPEGTRETTAAVFDAVRQLGGLGAVVTRVSFPQLLSGADVLFAALVEAATSAALGWPTGDHQLTEPSEDLVRGMHQARTTNASRFPPAFKLALMLGTYLNDELGGILNARARRLAMTIRGAVDRLFEEFDVLAMPTTTHYAHREDETLGIADRVLRGWDMLANAPTFNLTGHPAISLPLAEADGLPVGVMLVAPRFSDAKLLETSQVCERQLGWRPTAPPRAAKPQAG
jgi:amidase